MVLRSQKEKEKKYFDEVSQFLREKIKNTKHNKLTSFCFFEWRIVLYNQGSKIWWPDWWWYLAEHYYPTWTRLAKNLILGMVSWKWIPYF